MRNDKRSVKIVQEKGMVIDTATELTNDDLKIETEAEERQSNLMKTI